MISKLIGSIIIAASFTQLFPTDVAFLEPVIDARQDVGVQTLVQEAWYTLPQSGYRNYPVKVNLHSHGIVTTAWSALVVDEQSGAVLFQKEPGVIRSIASVTKLMTALVFLEQNPDLNTIVQLDPKLDYRSGGRVYLGYFNGIALRDVLAASLVGSDNTATQALVRFSGLREGEFIERMNTKARDLGMENSFFTDVTGLDAGNMSTARDLVLLLEAAEDHPIIRSDVQLEHVTITQASGRQVTIYNTNTLLTSFLNQEPYDVVGGKTGYLPQAGYVLATTVERDGHRVHVIVMGAESKEAREQETKGLAYWAFETFTWPDTISFE